METKVNRKGQTALISGASEGIGKEIALSLAEDGINSVLLARREDKLKTLVGELEAKGVRGIPFVGDASLEDDVKRLHDTLQAENIKIDILVNNVGVGKYGNLASTTLAEYDWMMNTNMRSTFLLTHFFMPAMLEREDGDIVFIGSVAGMKGLPGEAVYCASKHAQMAFAESLDYECREKNVRITVVAPGGVSTEFAMGTGREKGMPILDKMMKAEDIAAATRFALQQPAHMRYFLIGMRPMSEPL